MLSEANLLRRLLADSISTFCVLFRHALVLHGEEPPLKKRDIVARASERFAFDPLPFRKLLDMRENLVKPRDLEPVALLASYMQGISSVIESVDRLEK
jgi:hypothetical protein